MSFLKQLYYYTIAMRRQRFATVPCPQCGTVDNDPFLRFDRYLLPVHFAMCHQCSLIHTSRNFSGETLYQFYRDDYRRFYENATNIGAKYLYQHKSKLNAAYRLLRIREIVPRFNAVLEIGSGLGYFLEECRGIGIANIRGLELGDHFRTYAQQTLGFGAFISDQRYETIDALQPRPDLAAMFHVFEHLEDPVGCLRWTASQLAPGGTLVIEVPDMTGDWSSLGISQFHTAHRWYFSPTTLSNMLAANGFEPYFITRDDGDGIYPGNLRVFARVGDAGACYPLAADRREAMLATIHRRVNWIGIARSARRLIMQAWRMRSE